MQAHLPAASRILALAALLLSCSCINLRVGPDEEFFRMKGLANVHGTLGGLNDWDGTFLDIGLFTNTRGRGELLSVELGPLAGFGVGLIGARARVLPLEIGVGTLFYNPRPRDRHRDVEPPEAEWPEQDTPDVQQPQTAPEPKAKQRNVVASMP